MSLSSGTKLGPYEILSPLGAGGMGEVYRARDAKLKRDVAIKVLPESLAKDSDALARFEREALAVAALSHPNILAIFDFGSHDGVAYAVMELLEGSTLRDKLEAGLIPQKQALDYALQIAKGLSAAHEKGIVHRDLKPENLFVSKDGHLKILDFGLAKQARAHGDDDTSAPTEEQQTEPGTVLGTVSYMSPEQVRGLRIDHRSDIFSFGAILYEMLSGKRAFKRESAADTMAAILKEEPPELSESGRSIPPALDHVVKHCLEKRADQRFHSAHDVAFALQEIASGAHSSVPSVEDTPASSKRSVLIPVVAVAAVLLAVGAVLIFHRRPPASPLTAAPSIAVLPFTNLSSDKDQEYFSDGLSEELMGLLTKVKELHVAGRTSSFAFKGKAEDLRTIGTKLNVATVLEGSVRRSGDRLRVSTQLVNVANGFQIWAETYDRKMTEIFAVQDEIAGAVVAALKVKLLPQERPVASRHRTSNPEAYNQYLLGRQLFNPGSEDMQRSFEAFQKAIALDPSYAAAWAGLAVSGYLVAENAETLAGMKDGQEKALAAADKALSLDPELAEGFAARAFLRFSFTWDWAGARADFERALVLDPGDSNTHWRYGRFLASQGQLQEAIAESRKSAELDPLSAAAWSNYAGWLLYAGQREEARTALAKAKEINPNFGFTRWFLGEAALFEGDPKGALLEFRRAQEVFRQTGIAIAEHDLGHSKESNDTLEELIAKHAQRAAYQIADVFAWRGERDTAFEWLERAYAQRDGGLPELVPDPLLAKLRDDPRYGTLLRKMKLPVGK